MNVRVFCIALSLCFALPVKSEEVKKTKQFTIAGKSIEERYVNSFMGITFGHFFCGYIGRYSVGDVDFILSNEHIHAGREAVEVLLTLQPEHDNSELKNLEKSVSKAIRHDLFEGKKFSQGEILKSIPTPISAKEDISYCRQLFPIHLRLMDLIKD